VIVPVRFGDGRPLPQALSAAAARFAGAAERWRPGDRPHVWVFDLRPVLGAPRSRLLDGRPEAGWLSSGEGRRADAMRPARRAEFLSGRMVLRSLIRAYAAALFASPSSPLRFSTRPGGKPLVRTADGLRSFRTFNASTSHGILAAAIAPSREPETEVGIDVEVVGGPDRSGLRSWVGAEARLKCVGVGLGSVEAAPDVARALAATSLADLSAEWRGGLDRAGPSVRSDWPELELALAWSSMS
jgi:hypothetical protein